MLYEKVNMHFLYKYHDFKRFVQTIFFNFILNVEFLGVGIKSNIYT